MNFLIVEDDEKTARNLKKFLESDDIHIFLAEDSYSAQRLLLTTRMDAILSDLNLPYRDGFSLARSIKGDQITKAIPFFLYSSKPLDNETMALAKRCGVDECIPETDPEKIVTFARNYLYI